MRTMFFSILLLLCVYTSPANGDLVVSVNGVTYNVSIIETSYDDSSAILEAQPVWLNSTLAWQIAAAVGGQLGWVNYIPELAETAGPLFVTYGPWPGNGMTYLTTDSILSSGDGCSYGPSLSSTNYYALVTLTTATVSVSASPANGGTVTGGGTFSDGSSVTVAATANSGYTFTNWTENGSVVSASASYTFTLTTNESLVANFTTNEATITVNPNPTAGGTVSGGGTYAVGSQVQISATAAMFYTFTSWNGGNTDNPRTITVPSPGATYTATFSPMPVITFYHQPGDDNNGAGHAFLSLTWKNGDIQFWGFYSTGWILGVTPGIVAGGEPNWDFNIAYPITVVEYDAAATVITQDRIWPPWYSLLTFNCMNWAIKVANAAGVQLPSSHDNAGVADPRAFGASLAAIGNGNTTNGGLVTESGAPDPPTPFDYSYSGLENAGHTNAAALATSIGLAYDAVSLGTVNANTITGISLNIVGPNTNQEPISIDWGDGSVFQEQLLTYSHVYSSGTYQANLLVIDTGAVHSYTMTVTVSSSPASSITVNVTSFPPQSIPNQGFVSASPVPDFNVVETMSMLVLPNGHAVIGFLGIPTLTYTIQAASNLTQGFVPIGSVTAGTNGVFQYDDPGAFSSKSRFYRASYP